VGFNAPFGGGLTWPDAWRGRYELVAMNLQVLGGHLAASYQVTPTFSLGLTGSVYSASVSLDKHLDLVDHDGTASLAGSGFGFGGGLGAWYAPNKSVRVGFVGKLPVATTLKGRAHFENVPAAFNAALQDQAIESKLTLPGKLGLGAEVRVAAYRLYADAEYTAWSSFQSFAVDFESVGTPDVNQARDWANSLTGRVGAERDFGLNTVRAGVMVDGAASPANTLSPSLPDSTRVGASLGYGRTFGGVQLDLAYQFVLCVPRGSTGEALPANNSASAHLFALSFSYRQTPSEW
jgi:long-chain fatty acid transport protein